MAFKDITVYLYNGSIKITYLDKPHMYFKQDRINFDLPKEDLKAWGPKTRPAGTTTVIDQTLEKKGLMTWPMGLALGELFGFYNFKNDKGEQMLGFSRDKGTLWNDNTRPSHVLSTEITEEEVTALIKSASEAYLRQKKKGADIGSVVHDAIEHYVTDQPFNMLEVYTASVNEAEYEDPADKQAAINNIVQDVKEAALAFDQFKKWWKDCGYEVLGVEDLVYSKEFNVSGTYDGRLAKDGKLIIADWKTSKASKSREAASPQGIYYTYFLQSAIYALAWLEMTGEKADDLLIVSCRKDGGFDALLASEVGLTMDELLEWAKCVIMCYRIMYKTKKALLAKGDEKNVDQ